MQHYDSIVVGAGHNGLVCAAYLARKGQSVLVVEAADAAGGLAASREFHPGFYASVAHTVSHFSDAVVTELKLENFGYERAAPAATVGLDIHGNHVSVDANGLHGADDNDRRAYDLYRERMQRFAAALEPFWHKTMPRIGVGGLGDAMTFAQLGLNIRRLGKQEMGEFLRIFSLPMRDLMDENFNSDVVKAMLCWDGLAGARLAPRSPNAAVLQQLFRQHGSAQGMHAIPAGGTASLMASLRDAAIDAGAEIRFACTVDRLLVDSSAAGLQTVGVAINGGEQVKASRVISSLDPRRTFHGLAGVENLEIGFSNRIRRLRCDGYVAKMHLALDGLPAFTGIDRPDSRMILAAEMDSYEFAFDAAKYGECPEEPVMEIVIPSVHGSGVAPDGKHVLSANVMYVPYALKGGWSETARASMLDKSLERLERYAPGIRNQVLASEFLTPADIESNYHVTGGHWHHTEFAMDQLLMMRPTYEAAQYKTPLPGLYLCGAGCHPGGGLSGACGRNAAREILQ